MTTTNRVFQSAIAKLYLGNKASNIRIELASLAGNMQHWANEKAQSDVVTFNITSANQLTHLIGDAGNRLSPEAGPAPIRVLEEATITFVQPDTGELYTESFGKSGNKFWAFLNELAEEESAARESLESALEKAVNSSPTGVVVNKVPADDFAALEEELEPELGLVEAMDEQFAHPGLVHRFGFPQGVMVTGSLEVTLPTNEVITYDFPAEESELPMVQVRVPSASEDEDEQETTVDLDTLNVVSTLNHLLDYVATHGVENMTFRMMDTLVLSVPALELEYNYLPEKKVKLTQAKREEFGSTFIADVSALAVETYTPFDLRMHSDFSFEDFQHVTTCYGAALAERCRDSSPDAVLHGKVQVTGWVTAVEGEAKETLLFNGDYALNEAGATIPLGIALGMLMEADTLKFLPDSRMATLLAEAGNGVGMAALTSVAITFTGQKPNLVSTPKGLLSVLGNFHAEQVEAVASEVKAVNNLIDTQLSVTFSELMVDFSTEEGGSTSGSRARVSGTR